MPGVGSKCAWAVRMVYRSGFAWVVHPKVRERLAVVQTKRLYMGLVSPEAHESSATLPHNNSTSGMVGMYRVVGAVYQN